MIHLDQNEKVIKVVRRHWFVFGTEIFFFVLVALGAPLAYFFLGSFGLTAAWGISFNALLFFGYFVALIILWLISFSLWTDYYLDTWIITDKKVIDVEQKGLFARDVATLRWENIQDVKAEISGLVRTLLDIGDIRIQTAGTSREFLIPGARHPREVKRLLVEVHTKKLEEVKTVRLEIPPTELTNSNL